MKKKIILIVTLLLAMLLNLNCKAASEDEILLAKAVEAEAHGESYTVMASLASVLLNRISSDSYPGELGAVISDAGIDISVSVPSSQAMRAVHDAALGFDPTSGALEYKKSAVSDSPLLLFVDGWSFY
jgi:spore germination cell wall hydrolase CwlJ-like protein